MWILCHGYAMDIHYVCILFHVLLLLFTALHVMHTRYSNENSVRLSHACMQNLRKTYDYITGILRKREICGKWCHSHHASLCRRLLLVEYFELKITDNQSDDFLSFWKMTYHFPKKILGSRISLTYKRLMKIIRRTYRKSYENFTKFGKSGPRSPRHLVGTRQSNQSPLSPSAVLCVLLRIGARVWKLS